MCGEADTVTVFVREFLAERDEWLDVSSRANNLYNDIEGWWGSSRLGVETRRRMGRGWRGSGLFMSRS